MTWAEIFLWTFGAAAGFAAVLVLISRNVLYAALSLVSCLLSIAAIYIILYAEFLGIVQIMVYAAGVVVLILFGIMLTGRSASGTATVQNGNTFSGMLAGLIFFGMLCYAFSTLHISATNEPAFARTNVNFFGGAMLTTHVVAFETAGLLMLMSLIAAAVIASDFLPKKDKR